MSSATTTMTSSRVSSSSRIGWISTMSGGVQKEVKELLAKQEAGTKIAPKV